MNCIHEVLLSGTFSAWYIVNVRLLPSSGSVNRSAGIMYLEFTILHFSNDQLNSILVLEVTWMVKEVET